MRRAVPLVILAEDYFQFNANIGCQFALDAVFQRYDMSDPATHKVALVKPFTSVTVVINEDFLAYRSIISDAAERSNGSLRIEVVASGKTPSLLPESFQLKIPKPNGQPDSLVRFSVIVNCSQRFHDKLPSVSEAQTFVDLIHYCGTNATTVPRDTVYFSLVQKLEAYCQAGNLWLERSFRSSTEAAQTMATSMRTMTGDNVQAILRSRETNAHWNSCVLMQWIGIASFTAASVYLSLNGF